MLVKQNRKKFADFTGLNLLQEEKPKRIIDAESAIKIIWNKDPLPAKKE